MDPSYDIYDVLIVLVIIFLLFHFSKDKDGNLSS